uniref:FHA domain-containing protein n=1 Tax=Pristionchus pacificus TaxID=54126 RepID=A0A2A6BAR3_PRIPA|eukprot:PDM62956.1 hypothetical protein PRIPAC_50171 [Pristionchus pacificus]
MTDAEAGGDFKMPSLPVAAAKESEPAATPKVAPPAPPQKKLIIAPPFEYTPPPFACDPDDSAGYRLEVLKDGSIVESIDLSKRKAATYLTIGRLPECDITLEHPSISRYHAVLQFGAERMSKGKPGWYIYDMGSTHGSKLNKNTLPANQYHRVQVGMMLRFGGSTRLFAMVGPEEDVEPEWDCSPTEMRERMAKKALERKLAKQAREELEREEAEARQAEGCNWGMDYEDAGPSGLVLGETDVSDSHLMEDREAYYMEAPVKALSKFFEREGFDMEFTWSETGVNSHNHKWICSIELPIEVGSQKSPIISATVTTSKKDAQVQCSLEACRFLDTHGVLRKSTAVSRIKRKTVADEDFYEEDDDEYLDRTGQIEEQRRKRKMWAESSTTTSVSPQVESYESLQKKLEETKKEADAVEKQLEKFRAAKQAELDCEDLDEYVKRMAAVGGSGMDQKAKTEKSLLTQRFVKLKHECQKLEKLVKIAKPVELPALKTADGKIGMAVAGSSQQALFRKMMQMRKAQPTVNESKKREEDERKKKEKEEKEGDYNYELKFVPSDDAAKQFQAEEDEEIDEKMMKGPQLPPASKKEEKKEEKKVEESKKKEDEGEKKEEIEEKEEVKREASKREGGEMDGGVEEKRRRVEGEEEKVEKEEPVQPSVGEETQLVQQQRKNRPRHRGERKEREEKEEKKKMEGGLDMSGEYGTGVTDADETYATWLPPSEGESDAQKKLKEKFAGKY